MESLDDLQRGILDAVYTWRIPIAVGSMVVALLALMLGWRMGWFASARRHPGRSVAMLAIVLAIGSPLGYYLASPIWVRTTLVEPDPVLAVAATPSPSATLPGVGGSLPSAQANDVPLPDHRSAEPTPFVARTFASGMFRGTDEFHFGRGTARVVETAPGRYALRLDEFSVRNGPDLYVYLSPKNDDYAPGALELGRLKATDGAFGYDLPAGADPADFASAIIWCKQFSHLFAVAPLAAS